MKPWKIATKLLVWCYLSGSAPAAAQVGLLPDSTRLQQARAGQPFPFARGVSMELATYRQVRLAGLLADTVLASKNRRLDALTMQLETGRQLYANCAAARAEAEAATDRQAAALNQMSAHFARLDTLRKRAAWAPFTPATAAAFLLGLGAGLYGATLYFSP